MSDSTLCIFSDKCPRQSPRSYNETLKRFRPIFQNQTDRQTVRQTNVVIKVRNTVFLAHEGLHSIEQAFPSFRDFEVCHHYLQTNSRMLQSRLRRRGRKGKWSYTHTIRKQVSLNTGPDLVEILEPCGVIIRHKSACFTLGSTARHSFYAAFPVQIVKHLIKIL